MFANASYPDTYDLYRPTTSTTATGYQTITQGSAVATDLPCRFIPLGPERLAATEIGMDAEYNAQMLIPYDQGAAIQPQSKTEDRADRVVCKGRTFVVLAVHDAAGAGRYRVCYLQETDT